MPVQDTYHVGFPKCASSLLQRQIFPLLHSDQKVFFHVNYYEWIRRQIESAAHSSSTVTPVSSFRKSTSKNIFSYEGISHMANDWGPCFWEPSFELAKSFIPQNAHILFVLRNPSDYLYSCFKHSLRLGEMHNNIKSFFLSSNEYPEYYEYYGALASKRHFNLSKYNLLALRDMWCSYFTDVNFIVLDTSFINTLLSSLNISVTETTHARLMNIFSNNKVNKSISDIAAYLSQMRSELLLHNRFHTITSFSSVKFTDFSLQLFSDQRFYDQSVSTLNHLARSQHKLSGSNLSFEDYFNLHLIMGWKQSVMSISNSNDQMLLDLKPIVPDYLSEIRKLNYPHKQSNELFFKSLESCPR